MTMLEHEHKWGPVELAHFTGNPHRKCQTGGCDFVTLDLHDDELTNWTVSYAVRNIHGVAWIDEATVYACEDSVEDAVREHATEEYGPIDTIIMVDFTRHNPEDA